MSGRQTVRDDEPAVWRDRIAGSLRCLSDWIRGAGGEGHETDVTRHLYAMAVRQSNDAIFIHDLEGKVLVWNEAAARLFGFDPEIAIGVNVRNLHLAADREFNPHIRRLVNVPPRGGGWRHGGGWPRMG